MKTIIVWFRNDLRIHDNPALSVAASEADRIVPVFILNDELLSGPSSSTNRNRFLLECLADLRSSLRKMGSNLVILRGNPETKLVELATETAAEAIYYTADYTPYALNRDKALKKVLDGSATGFRAFPGRLAVSSLQKLVTKSGGQFKVFTPFYNAWLAVGRRELASVPNAISLPPGIAVGRMPLILDFPSQTLASPEALPGGETAGRARLKKFLSGPVEDYHQGNNDMAANSTSRLSSYLHFGCLSAREIETMLPDSAGARAWRRQLAWREFYHYIVFYNPSNTHLEFQEKYRTLKWDSNPKLLTAWQQGKTGYPAVDAGMRQLNREGWMHNRARLIVGSFLTKDLWLNWRAGEQYFMQLLIDGDTANNNGNWQWIASVGVDPAPVYRRLYNPSRQRDNFDPTGAYVRRYIPELKDVPDAYLSEPWTMPDDVQKASDCIIGKDYPRPIVDHKVARQAALDQYRSADRNDS